METLMKKAELAKSICNECNLTPYVVTIQEDEITIQGDFERKAVRKLKERNPEFKINDSGFVIWKWKDQDCDIQIVLT
jgi:hypothetical protein